MQPPGKSFLNESPEYGYFGALNQYAMPKNKAAFFKTQFVPQYDLYKGQLGQQILSGQDPTLNWTDILQTLFSQGGGADQQWAGMSPWARGENSERFNPPTQFQSYQGRRGVNALGSGYGGF